MFQKLKFTSLSVITLLALCFVVGCGNRVSMKDVYSTNIKKLYGSYMLYMEEHSYVGPKDEAQLKAYLKENPTAIHLLKRIDVSPETVDEMFISERDGEPFVVRYGLRGVADHAVVFEATGIEGVRLIALAEPIEVDDEQMYDDYLSGKIKPVMEGSMGVAEDE